MEFNDIIELLPEGYKEACWETKAMSRKRGIQDEEMLLTLCLFYAYDRSLIDTQNYAKTFLSISISDVGFMKRFVRCKDWIKWINQHMAKDEHQMYVKCALPFRKGFFTPTFGGNMRDCFNLEQ